nr:complement C1q tumor necrosis factor-related protein 3 isoform X1 [Crassostrea gigas]
MVRNLLDSLEKNPKTLDSCPSKTPVVFHAEMSSHKTFEKGSIWIYDKVVVNEGNAYNPITGKFTAPTNGVYQFNWYTLSDFTVTSNAGLFVNGKRKACQASTNSAGRSHKWVTSGSGMALPLKKGDEVYIGSVYGGIAKLRSHFTAFGGVRIN